MSWKDWKMNPMCRFRSSDRLVVAPSGDGSPLQDVVPGGGPVEAPEEVQEGGLSRAGGADDGHELALMDVEVEPVEDLDGCLARAIGLRDPAEADHRLRGGGGSRCRHPVGPFPVSSSLPFCSRLSGS
jgi:hypothetical protein